MEREKDTDGDRERSRQEKIDIVKEIQKGRNRERQMLEGSRVMGTETPQRPEQETEPEAEEMGRELCGLRSCCPVPLPRTLLALGCHVGMADEKAEDNLKKTKLPKT